MGNWARRWAGVALLAGLTAGCSNAPVAGFLDNCFPSRARLDGPPGPAPDVKPRPPGAGDPAPKGKSDGPLPPPDLPPP